MKVLIACEESQRVCTEFRKLGHEAYSCDVIDCSGGHPEWHIKGDCLPLLQGNCTFETVVGGATRGRQMGFGYCTPALYVFNQCRDKTLFTKMQYP